MRDVRHAVYGGLCVVLFAATAAASGGPPRLFVDNDLVQCPTAAYTTIQAAVNAAPPGATILVCPGTYAEQVKIQKPLTIMGIEVARQNAAVIMPPSTAAIVTSFTGALLKPAVIVTGTTGVQLSNLTVDGSTLGDNTCASRTVGVYYGNASGEIDGLAVRFITNGPSATGCQGGLGIFVQSDGVGGRSDVEVENSTVHDYDKNGITGNEVGTRVRVHGNTVTGSGEGVAAAQNGIQIGFGARGTIEANAVINHVWVGCTAADCASTATNVLIFGASGVDVRANSLGRSQVNVLVQRDTDFPAERNHIGFNAIFENDVFDGVALIDADENRVHDNIINDSDEAGVWVQGDRNHIHGNTINETPCGVQRAGGANNRIEQNHYLNTVMTVCQPPAMAATTTARLAAAPKATANASAAR